MLKQIAWNTFKTTGNINTMLELLEVDKTMRNIGNANNIEITNEIVGINNNNNSNDNSNSISNRNYLNSGNNEKSIKDVEKEDIKWES